MKSLIAQLGAIGDRPDDDDPTRLRHKLLVYMGVLMSGGGIMWGSLAAAFGLKWAAIVPYGYVVVTAFNLTYFKSSKDFRTARMVQVFISLLLPFLFQWSLGGFTSSGAVMLWAMLAIVGSLTFGTARAAIGWLGMYCVLTLASGAVDSTVREMFSANPSEGLQVTFFVLNVVIISSIVFGLMIYVVSEREKASAALEEANKRITELNEGLEDVVATRTAELDEALAQLSALVDNMADGLLAVNNSGEVRRSNPAFSQLLLLPEDLDGDASQLIPAELLDLADESQQTNAVVKREISLPGDRHGAAVASPIHGTEGDQTRVDGSVVIVRDVTFEKEIDRMKTDFIATVSHELRTPLTSVLGFAKLTRDKLGSRVFPHIPEDDRKAVRARDQISGNIGIIISEGERLTSLINDVLDISKIEAGQMKWEMGPVAPVDLVEDAMVATAGLFENPNVKVRSDVADDLPTLFGDRDRLLQTVINLISNAAKFTDEGSVTVSAKRSNEGVEFSVTDTGPGIATAEQAYIFQKFKQVGDTLTDKPKGTGLGLPICEQIVLAHQGRIWVESELGKGARFAFMLPVHEVAPHATAATLDSLLIRIEEHVDRALPDEGGDILVVDDDKNLRELLRQQLSERGYEVRLAKDGTEAVKMVRDKPPELVVLDVMMPGITGFDVAAVLKSDPKTKHIPIIILSIIQDRDRGYRIGIDKYFSKPTEPDELANEIHRLLRRGRMPKRVLLAQSDFPDREVAALEARGFTVVGKCAPEDAIETARSTRPELIVVGVGGDDDGEKLVNAIRKERGFEHVYVVQLLEDEATP